MIFFFVESRRAWKRWECWNDFVCWGEFLDLGQLGEHEIGGSVRIHPYQICWEDFWILDSLESLRSVGVLEHTPYKLCTYILDSLDWLVLLATHELMNSQGGSVGVRTIGSLHGLWLLCLMGNLVLDLESTSFVDAFWYKIHSNRTSIEWVRGS